MKDKDALPELEFLMHYYEIAKGKKYCMCNLIIRNERDLQGEFIYGKHGIHVSDNLSNDILKT